MQDTQAGFTLWLTGLPCAGKTTIAMALEKQLQYLDMRVERLDGDTVREGLSRDLGFSKEDRDKNIERVTFVAKLLSRNGVAVIAAFISPYQAARDKARQETTNFIEVFIHAPLEICMERDVKGMYAKALRGEIQHFTGISDPYEAPQNPDIIIYTAEKTVQESVHQVLEYLVERGLLRHSIREAV